MKRIVLAFALVGTICRTAEGRPTAPPEPVRRIHPIVREPKHNFVWKVMNYFVVPAAKAAAADVIKGAITAVL